MTVKTITFMQTFPTGQFANQKLGVEVTLEEEDFSASVPDAHTVRDAFEYAKKIVNDAFREMNPDIANTTPTIYDQFHIDRNGYTEKEAKEERVSDRVAMIIQDINACTEIDSVNGLGVQVGLIAYANTVAGFPELQTAYDKRLKELQ